MERESEIKIRKGEIMKTAIVTGASSGIGFAICRMLIGQQIKVYGIGRHFDDEALQELRTLDEMNLFTPVQCDLVKTNEVIDLIKNIQKKEEIDILINNAGVGYFGPHEELNPNKIHEMVTVNLEVPLLLTNLLLRTLKKNHGFIINISSITAKKSNTYGCAYGATKAALTSFSKSLFDEARKYGVKVVSIHPDMTKSNFYRNANFKEGESLDTYLLPEEVASAVSMVLSQREGVVVSDITLQPQRHQLGKQNLS